MISYLIRTTKKWIKYRFSQFAYWFLVKIGFLYSPSVQWAKWAMGEELHSDFEDYLNYVTTEINKELDKKDAEISNPQI